MPSNTEDEEKSEVLGMEPTKKGGAGCDSEGQAATEARTSEGKDPTGREVGRGAASPADILEQMPRRGSTGFRSPPCTSLWTWSMLLRACRSLPERA
jgi:hypothetical protein